MNRLERRKEFAIKKKIAAKERFRVTCTYKCPECQVEQEEIVPNVSRKGRKHRFVCKACTFENLITVRKE